MKLSRIFSLSSITAFALFAANPAYADNSCDNPCDNTGDQATVETAIEAGVPALWKVADEDTTIYLFGTVHVLPDDVEWYSGELKNALDESSTLVTEIDMNPAALSEIPQLLRKIAILPEGTALRDLFDEDQREAYDAAMTKLGLPVTTFDRYEPWFASLQLTNTALAAKGIGAENGSEAVLEATIGEDKQRIGLETIAYQFSVFDDLPEELQIKFLIQAAEEIDGLAPSLQAIIDEWAKGNVDGVAQLLNEALAGEPLFAERLLYDRNKNWAEWIDTRLDEPGTVFMAVGAGHLAGEKSVQDYLTERGIVTTRVQ